MIRRNLTGHVALQGYHSLLNQPCTLHYSVVRLFLLPEHNSGHRLQVFRRLLHLFIQRSLLCVCLNLSFQVFQAEYLFLHQVQVLLLTQALGVVGDQGNVLGIPGTEWDQYLMNLSFWVSRGQLRWKLRYLPNGDVLDAVDGKSHHAELSFLVESGWHWRGSGGWVSQLAMYHDVEQVNGVAFICLSFFDVLLVEVDADSQTPVDLSVLHVNYPANVHKR